MTHRPSHDHHDRDATTPDDALDDLLRTWHAQNRTTAAASREQLLTRVARDAQQAERSSTTSPHATPIPHVLRSFLMHRYTRIAASLVFVVALVALLFPPVTEQSHAEDTYLMLPDGGRLDAFNDDGKHIGPCPLKHTNVDVAIAGHFSRTTVKQRYSNPYDGKVEAVYTFPLGHNGAVDRMTMTIGDRVIVGEVQEREKARQTYEQARDEGYVASLLEQERPNIFTQSVANIEPGAEITIEISYVEVLESVDGRYSFEFPMVVAPRYIPGSPLGLGNTEDGTFAPDTDQVEDASRITPKPVKPDVRAGHDISVQVRIETGGLGITDIESGQHEIVMFDEQRNDDELTGVSLALQAETEIPNRDFVLSWKQSGKAIDEAILTHMGDYGDFAGGFFTMILQPPDRVPDEQVRTRELIFVLDSSGSMSSSGVREGYAAIDGAKDVIARAVDTMRPDDRFNIISFNNSVDMLWQDAQPASDDNRRLAQEYVNARNGGGGTEMARAVKAALQHESYVPVRLSPSELAELPADGRQVELRIEPSQLLMDRGGGYLLRVRDDLRIAVAMRTAMSMREIADPERVHLHIAGTWETKQGRRVLVVEQIKPVDRDDESDPMRIVLFLTDGQVGNDAEVVRLVDEASGDTRMFTIGMGSSPNRSILDKMAEAGRGAADYVLPGDDVEPIVQRFTDRIATPVLTDISLAFDGVEVFDVLPGLDRLPDLFDVSPLVIHGRYAQAGNGTVTIRGRTGAGDYERTVDLKLPEQQDEHDVIATLWARAQIDRLMPDEKQDQIVALGEAFQLMSKYTSFVAVEMQRKTVDGESTLVRVPIEFPKDMSWEGTFGEREIDAPVDQMLQLQATRGAPGRDRRAPASAPAPKSEAEPQMAYAWQQRELKSDDGNGAGAGSGGGGGGGGGIFGEFAADSEPAGEKQKAEKRLELAKDLIQTIVSSDAWQDFGGTLVALDETNGRLQPIALVDSQEAHAIVAEVESLIDAYGPIFYSEDDAADRFAGIGFEEQPTNLEALKRLHERTINVASMGLPLERVLDQVQRDAGLALHIDWPSLEAQSPELRLQSIDLPRADRSIAQTVHAILHDADELLEASLYIDNGEVHLASDTKARTQSTLVVYDVQELIETGTLDADRLATGIQDFIDIDGWYAMGGSTSTLHIIDRWLFIDTTLDNHRAIQRFLNDLREAMQLPKAQAVEDPAGEATKTPIRMYAVDDILDAARDNSENASREFSLEQLVRLQQELVDPYGWRAHGGEHGHLAAFGDVLIISHDRETHAQIEQLLEQVRSGISLEEGGRTEAVHIGNDTRQLVLRDVRDIVGMPVDDDKLRDVSDLILTMVDTNHWYDHGGNVGYLVDFAGVLVIATTERNQNAIDQLLQKLRDEVHEEAP